MNFVYAIGKVNGKSATVTGGLNIEIVSCDEESRCKYIGLDWICPPNRRHGFVPQNDYCLVRFVPDDQCCEIISLNNLLVKSDEDMMF
jgi:hypothetical protein